jgi:hypothetical protein
MKHSLERAKRGTVAVRCQRPRVAGFSVTLLCLVQALRRKSECHADPCEPVMTDSLPTMPKSLKANL